MTGNRRSLAGHEPPFTCIADRTFRRRLRTVSGQPIVSDERSHFGLTRRSGGGCGLRQQCAALLTMMLSDKCLDWQSVGAVEQLQPTVAISTVTPAADDE